MRIVLTEFQHPSPPNPEMMAAWRVLKQEPAPDGIVVILDKEIEMPNAEPLVVLRWPVGVIPVGKEQHLVLWRDKLWWCTQWRSLLGKVIPDFSKFSSPLIDRTYPQLLATTLVGVQPMSAPAGLVSYIKFNVKGRN